ARTILSAHPEDVEVREQLGLLLIQAGEGDRAVNELEEVARRAPERMETRKHLGRWYMDHGRSEEALAHFETAVELDSTFAEGWLYTGFLRSRLGKTREAVAAFGRSVKLDPDRSGAHLFLGLCYNDLAEYEAAEEALDRYLELEPADPEGLFARGAARERLEKPEEAAADLREVIRIRPQDTEAMNYLGYMFAERGIHLTEAVQLLEEAVRLSPENAYYLDSLAWAHFRSGRPEAARNLLLRALENSRAEPVILDHLGDVLSALGDGKGAREAWEKAWELDSTLPGLAEKRAAEGAKRDSTATGR
ncbi:MAG: tetratricopeptide repeat protein, partial [Gemmatimonadota bacterium]|nr:tetratricopeptide repeat protein [Gemmatimonadota bacterium]